MSLWNCRWVTTNSESKPGVSQKYVQQGITLEVNETATVPVHLAVGAEGQVLEVNADAQLIQGTVTSLGKTVTEREVLDLPLNGRNFTQLGLLQPGVVPLTPGLSEAGGSLRAGQSYAVNGQRPESNNFVIDGANNFNGVDGGFVLKPPVDAITEFRILTHNANAEFGKRSGFDHQYHHPLGYQPISRSALGILSQRCF